jgi:replicative DNA helicase
LCGAPVLIVRSITDMLALAAAGLAAAAAPHKPGIDIIAAHLRRLGEPRCVIVLGEAGTDGLAGERADALKTLLPDWPVRYAGIPHGHPSAIAWVRAFGADTTLADAWGDLGDRMLEQLDETCSDAKANATADDDYTLEFIDTKTFNATDYTPEWLVEGAVVAKQPALAGGPNKALKTSIMLDLALSLGFGESFLGHFRVPKRRRVGVLSGESGEFTLQETARRICVAKQTNLDDASVFWGFRLPQLANPKHLDVLAGAIKKAALEVLVLDPLYLSLLSGSGAKELNASNLYDMGPLLLRVARACLDAGATPILVHHTRKTLNEPYAPLTLADLAFSGVAEFARQWCLINRRAEFEPGTGLHKMWVNIGGSTGQNKLLSLDVDEGQLDVNFCGRQWDLKVEVGQQARNAARNERDEQRRRNADRQATKDEIALLRALDHLAGKDGVVVARKVRLLCAWGAERFDRTVVRLVQGGWVEAAVATVIKGNGAENKCAGLRRVGQGVPKEQEEQAHA